jgi:uncharacterized membrane protein
MNGNDILIAVSVSMNIMFILYHLATWHANKQIEKEEMDDRLLRIERKLNDILMNPKYNHE